MTPVGTPQLGKSMMLAPNLCTPPFTTVSPGLLASSSQLDLTQGGITLFPFPCVQIFRNSLIAQLVKSLPAVQETPVRFLGQEDRLEKG